MASGKTVWAGSQTASGTLYINQPDLFGGEKKEGGIQGSLLVLMGGRTQVAPPALAGQLGSDAPGFRGVVTLFYDGLISCMNPYIKPWEIWTWRTTAGWEDDDPWYPERATILLAGENGGQIHAMNPAHIIYECHTNHDWGAGIDRSTIDDAQMRAAANTLYAEGFGLCLAWTRQSPVADFIQLVCDHIGGQWRQNKLTGKFELKLFRDDYNPAALPVFDEDSGLLGVEEDESAALDGAVNEVIVKWEEPASGEARQWRERNLAAISFSGQIVSETIEYAGLPTAALAGRLAARDLMLRASALKRFKLRFDRRAYKIQIGDVFCLRSQLRGIDGIVLRAGRVEDGTLDNGEIAVTAVQDIFGLPATGISAPPPPAWVEPDKKPYPVTVSALVELSWRDVATWLDPANLELLRGNITAAYLGLLAAAPSSLSYGFGLQTRVGAAAWESHDDGVFAGVGALAAAIPIGAGAAAFALTNTNRAEALGAGDAVLIDSEICRVVSYDPASGAGTLARGCVDTVPAAHLSGSRVWLLDEAVMPAVAWTANTTVQARALTKTSMGMLDPAQAPVSSITLTARQARPYPPGNFRINGAAYPAAIPGDAALTVTWSHRDRIVQADQLIDTAQGNIGPEPGTTYRLRIYSPSGTLRRTYDSITGTSQVYSADDEVADGGPFTTLRIVLDSARDGLRSHQAHDWTVTRND
jgi:hypothetical protein